MNSTFKAVSTGNAEIISDFSSRIVASSESLKPFTYLLCSVLIFFYKEYKNLLRIAAKDQERLGASLTPEQAELFEKYDSAVKEVNATAEVEAFSYGFRLGVRLMTEPFGVIRDKA